jgi:hypothetical protein
MICSRTLPALCCDSAAVPGAQRFGDDLRQVLGKRLDLVPGWHPRRLSLANDFALLEQPRWNVTVCTQERAFPGLIMLALTLLCILS